MEIIFIAWGGQSLPQLNCLLQGVSLLVLFVTTPRGSVIHVAVPMWRCSARLRQAPAGATRVPRHQHGLICSQALSPPGPQGSQALGKDFWSVGCRSTELQRGPGMKTRLQFLKLINSPWWTSLRRCSRALVVEGGQLLCSPDNAMPGTGWIKHILGGTSKSPRSV